MKKHLFLIAGLAISMAACTNDVLTPEDNAENNTPSQETPISALQTAKLSVFSGDQSRVKYEPATRAEDDLEFGKLKLIATIDNPDKEVFSTATSGDGGRYMSATSVFKNSDGNYYVTYHIQGNNYNTDLNTSIGGTIQVFNLEEDSEGKIKVNMGDGFTAAKRNLEDYDFNHIYFDKTSSRIIVAGHKWSVPDSWTSDEQYTGENTRAIIGAFDPTSGKLDYKTVTSSIEVRDDQNKLIDHEDAADVNCVIRIYNQYYLATRKGIAVVNADEENLFQPVLNEDKTRYFIPTKGSCKYVYNDPNDDTRMFFLYLSEDKENIKDQTSEAKILEFKVSVGDGNKFHGFVNEDTHFTLWNTNGFDLTAYADQSTLPAYISPIDGKNTICSFDNGEKLYAALGKGGLYYKHPLHYNTSEKVSGVVDFGNLPVNCVYAERPSGESFHGGYVYVANGARLTILDRASLDTENNSVNIMGEYTLSAKDGIDENTASANFINVELGNSYEYSFIYNGQEYKGTVKERIITVAYGQAGVRIFRFLPKVSQAYIDLL